MGDMTVEFTGLKELDEKLATLPFKMANKIEGKALRTGAKPLLEELQRETPEQSGLLMHSETISTYKTSEGRGVSIGITRYTAKNAYYGTWVNFGHKMGTRPPGLRKRVYPNDTRQMIDGEHFFETSWAEEGEQATELVVETLKELVDAAMEDKVI